MANYYTLFSEALPHLTADEEAWLRRQLEFVRVFGDSEYPEHELPDGLNLADADWSGHRLFLTPHDYDTEYDEKRIGEYEFRDDDQKDGWGRHLWLYAEEGGDTDLVAAMVQQFLKRFRPDQCWSMTFAYTCSSPRVGDFGGGAVFVTAADIQWEDTDCFVEQRRQAFTDTRRP